MGEGQIDNLPPSAIYDELCPYFMSIGMTYDQFWEGDANMVRAFKKAEDIRRNRENERMWLSGVYTLKALEATVGNLFNKGDPIKYPERPMPITEQQVKEIAMEKERLKMEAMKAQFMEYSLNLANKFKKEGEDGNN